MSDFRIFRMANSQCKTAFILLDVVDKDDYAANNICFWLQQSVERALIGFLELCGVTATYDNSMRELFTLCKLNSVPLIAADWLETQIDTLDIWKNKTRYDKEFKAGKDTAINGYLAVKKFLRQNGVCEELLPAITEDVLAKLKTYVPASYTMQNMYWNVLYVMKRFELGFEIKQKGHVQFDLAKYFRDTGITNYAEGVEYLKAIYGTNDINQIKVQLKEAYDKCNI